MVQDDTKGTLLGFGILVFFVVLGLGSFWLLGGFSSDGEDIPDANFTLEDVLPTDQLATDNGQAITQPSDEVTNLGPIEEAVLVAVNDYEGSGTATRQYNSEEYLHEVIAQLDDPEAGKFYEGWIVGRNITSTGRLVKEADGEWSLVFRGDASFRTYDEVVITEETEANGLDNVPETHVLEGSF